MDDAARRLEWVRLYWRCEDEKHLTADDFFDEDAARTAHEAPVGNRTFDQASFVAAGAGKLPARQRNLADGVATA